MSTTSGYFSSAFNDQTPSVIFTPLLNFPHTSNKRISSFSNSLLSSASHSYNVENLWHNRLGHVLFVKMKDILFVPVNSLLNDLSH